MGKRKKQESGPDGDNATAGLVRKVKDHTSRLHFSSAVNRFCSVNHSYCMRCRLLPGTPERAFSGHGLTAIRLMTTSLMDPSALIRWTGEPPAPVITVFLQAACLAVEMKGIGGTCRSVHYPERCSRPGEASTSGRDELVRFADIGCGFGGLLVK